ncbi:hypothetical protein SPBR_02995 [Sporothrix brasiliensis 5110]|uniref:Uncharacterized protein n=1 Tax=Sporothrix brasiliensis 5110 TaxID=1398154 RepID=A0A0C2IU26_9PEZI|nr:uncharacterized protein SPBR_02995 [Sporothrix brasiliensis 5110]KIH92611.1 hypothetical protein SPBR_02995 [Sporothrix brasiliensis 5110]
MCIIQRYTAWHCGCHIEESDPALVKICIAKARNAEAKCTLYVVPAFSEDLPVPCDCPSPQESCNSSSSSSSDSGDSVEDMVEPKAGQNGGAGIIECDGGPVGIVDHDSSGNSIPGPKELEDIITETFRVSPTAAPKEPSQGGLSTSGLSQTLDASEGANSELNDNGTIVDNCSEDADAGDADGWHDKSIEDEILADDIQSRRLQAATSPRMCPEHEAKFENLANAYWRSETLWLRPKMLNHGRRAYQDLVLAQRCADRLWELYLVWKFFNGGDPHGAAIVTGPDFQPLYRTSSGANEVCDDDNTTRNLKGVAEVDASRTLRAVSNLGDVTYRVLRWALDDLLTVLRDMLHPSEMLA